MAKQSITKRQLWQNKETKRYVIVKGFKNAFQLSWVIYTPIEKKYLLTDRTIYANEFIKYFVLVANNYQPK